jgi:diketogulonate reductase-like aldo/keto reductase
MEYVRLNDGNKIPAIGFGVFTIPNDGPTCSSRRRSGN